MTSAIGSFKQISATLRNNVARSCEHAIEMLLALWLLCGYLLVGTPLQAIAAKHYEETFLCSLLVAGVSSYKIGSVLIAVFAVGSYARQCTTKRSRYAWIGIVVLIAAFSYRLLAHLYDGTSLLYSQILNAFSFGLCAERLTTPRKIAWVLCLTTSVQAIYAMVGYWNGETGIIAGTVHRAVASTSSIEFSTTTALCLPLAIGLAIDQQKRHLRVIAGVCIILLIVALWLTFTRSVWLAEFAALLVLMLRLRCPKNYVLAAMCVLAVCTIAVFSIRTAGYKNQVSSSLSIEARPRAWRVGWDIFLKHPASGVGVTNNLMELDSIRHGETIPSFVSHPFNAELYWLDTMGIPGGLLFLYLTASVFCLISGKQPIIVIALGSAWIVLFIIGLTDSVLSLSMLLTLDCVIGILVGMTLSTESAAVQLPLMDIRTTMESHK